MYFLLSYTITLDNKTVLNSQITLILCCRNDFEITVATIQLPYE